VTTVVRLDEAGREREVARMMGGEGSATPQVLAGARELLAQAKAKAATAAKAKGESRARAKAKVR
jgi:hypothetical protein